MILGQGHSLRSGLFGGIIGSCRVHLLHTQRCSARSGNFAVFLHRADNRRSTPYNHGEISRALKTIKHSGFINGHHNATEQASTVPHASRRIIPTGNYLSGESRLRFPTPGSRNGTPPAYIVYSAMSARRGGTSASTEPVAAKAIPRVVHNSARAWHRHTTH